MIFDYAFFQHALLGGALAAVLCAMVGTYVVTRRLVIAGGGMAHASLGGVGLGAFLGVSPLVGAGAFALFTGYAVQWLGRRGVREDSAVALLWTFGMSLGILFAYLTPGFMTDLPGYLFGDILGISRADLWLMGLLTLTCGLFFALLLEPISTIAYDRDFAVTQGLPVGVIEGALTALLALTIVGCLRLVGVVLVISLLSIPQQTAALFTRTFCGMVLWSAFFGLLGIGGGLAAAYVGDVPSGAAIILVSIALYAICWAGKAIKGRFSSL